MNNDLQLIQACKRGEQAAFRAVVEQFEPAVRSTVLNMVGDTPEAEEVAQDVFIRFFDRLDQFEGQAQLKTYLIRIAINLSLNMLKKKQRQQRRFLFGLGGKEVRQVHDRTASTDRLALQDLIDQGLESLDPSFKAVLVLRLIEGYSVEETAVMLDIPKGTVGSRLMRAQKKLQEKLTQLGHTV